MKSSEFNEKNEEKKEAFKLLKFIQIIIKINFSIDAGYMRNKVHVGYSYRFHVDFIKYGNSDQLENISNDLL